MWISAHLQISLGYQNKQPDFKNTTSRKPRRNTTLNLKMWFRNKHTFNNPCDFLKCILFRTLKYISQLEFGIGFTKKKGEKWTQEDKPTCGSKQ